MSELQAPDPGKPLAESQVLEKVRSQFPTWATATQSRGAAATNGNGHSEFILASNWMLRPEGLGELSEGLKDIEGVQVTYEAEFSSLKIRCSSEEEQAIMAKCQSLMDKIVQGELDGGLAVSNKVIAPKQWHVDANDASKNDKKKSVMALAPSDIRGSVCRTAWIVPDNLVQKGVGMPKLVSSKAFAMLQRLTGCTMMMSSDGLSVYIGAESEDKLSMVERKLTTLAKYASIPSEADIRCESFIYAEDQQDALAKFTYLAHGMGPILRTFFLDRKKYLPVNGKPAYGRLFENGVVLTLSSDDLTPTPNGVGITPATPFSDRNGAYIAFSSGWRYRPKQASLELRSGDMAPSVPFDPNTRVTSWITKLPKPELMLPHGDEKNIAGPGSSANNGYSKGVSINDDEPNLTQKGIYEQKSQLLPRQINQIRPTLPTSSQEKTMPQPAQADMHEQQSQPLARQIKQAPLTLPKSSQGGLQKTTPQPAQEGMPKQQKPNVSQNGHATNTRGKRGNHGQKRGDGKHNGRQEGQRKRGNRGRRPYQQRPYGRQRPTEQPRINSNGGTSHVADQTPARFSHFPQRDSQNQTDNTVEAGHKKSDSARYVPPHLRYLNPGGQTGANGQASQDTPGAREGRLIDLDSDESDHEQRLEKLKISVDKMTEETQVQTGETRSLPTQSTTVSADPFADAWSSHRILPGNNQARGSQAGGSQAHGSQTRVVHSTMRQQAGAPTVRKYGLSLGNGSVREDPDPQMIEAMSQKIVRMMSSLEVFSGEVSLRADIGRLCLTGINGSYVRAQSQGQPLQDIKEALDKHYINTEDVMFTNILTAEGADANYIAFMNNSFGTRMWSGDTRRTVYNIFCSALTKDSKLCKFVIEVNGGDFTYRVDQSSSDSCSLFVHCPKRSWDFQVALAKSQDLGEDYNNFAKDLIDSMRITPQPNGIPTLELTIKRAFGVELLYVRTRNIASYVRKLGADSATSSVGTEDNTTSTMMEIREVHDMAPTGITETTDKVTALFQQRPVSEQLGHLGTWYEVSMQSKTVNKALQQNRDLELGEEVDWSPEKLQESGAFDELIRSTIEVVKNIDGVGYWGDNYQDAMIHGMPPTGSTTHSHVSGTIAAKPLW
ncbi:hypothetical protein F4781DRAFT_439477 [Annulohypoxylon bovei var. microspora]|nr:hypothetical protein F4781DRAFT_439477 [Annulohypoxylon bovei var. microspora]